MEEQFLRLSTGIPGLDDMLEGGFPYPSTILLAGQTGTGKSTFSLQFLFEGAKRGERGIFFTTLSEPTNWMLRFTSSFRFFNKDLLGKEIIYFDLGPYLKPEFPPQDRFETLLRVIEEKIIEVMPQRIVIDPVTVTSLVLKEKYREFLYELSHTLKNWQAVTLLTGESTHTSPFPLEPAYTSDGIIILYNIEVETGRKRYIEILKMRGTDHVTGKHLFDITKNGIVVHQGLK